MKVTYMLLNSRIKNTTYKFTNRRNFTTYNVLSEHGYDMNIFPNDDYTRGYAT